jgi:transcriptional regulator with XRE-family HTH domain
MNHEAARRFGEQIKRIRMDRKMSIRELAHKAGVDSGALTKIEHGRVRNPQPGTLRCLSEGLGEPLADLFVMAGYVTPSDLPSLSYYLHTKYKCLPREAVDDVEQELRRLIDKYRAKEEIVIDWSKEVF